MNKTPHFLLTEEEVVTPAVNSIILQTNKHELFTFDSLFIDTEYTQHHVIPTPEKESLALSKDERCLHKSVKWKPCGISKQINYNCLKRHHNSPRIYSRMPA